MQKFGQRGAATIRVLLAIVLGIAWTGCASRTDLMNYNTTPGIAFQAPTADQALIVFVRTEPGDTSASVFDGEVFLGVLVGRSYIAQPTTPGEHRFMVISEAADFMDATLDPGRVYFARIESRFGVWRARFSLIPISPLEPQWNSGGLAARRAPGHTDTAGDLGAGKTRRRFTRSTTPICARG
jgi:hypothetical protein